jgi:hypothetical protein
MSPANITGVLPRNITACMSPEDQRAIMGATPTEAREQAAAKDEKQIQRDIANYLRLHRIVCDQDAMNKKRTGTKGWPDFTFPYRGKNDERARFVAWEVKCPWSTKLLPEQNTMREALEAAGAEWRLITSLEDAQKHLREIDGIQPSETK